jgi:hypothetical protein
VHFADAIQMQSTDAKEVDIKSHVQEWLKYAPYRPGGGAHISSKSSAYVPHNVPHTPHN